EGGDDPHAPGPGRGTRPGQVGPGHAGLEAVDGGEGVAPGPQAVDDAGQGGHGLGTVAGAVVEEDDGVGRRPGQHPVDDGAGAGAAPVARVVGPPNGVHAQVEVQLVGALGVGPG